MLEKKLGERRNLICPGNKEETVEYAAKHFIKTAQKAIKSRGKFVVALSGGSTPKAIFEKLTSDAYKDQMAWDKVYLFFSDERAVEPTSEDSNYHMAMTAGFEKMPIPKEQIFRMKAEKDIVEKAAEYEEEVKKHLPFDLIMLGMGEDGHTASLFPETEALDEQSLVAANFVKQKNAWRMTFTFPLLNQSSTVFYVTGEAKREMLKKVLGDAMGKPEYPAQRVGTSEHPATWIVDSKTIS